MDKSFERMKELWKEPIAAESSSKPGKKAGKVSD